MRLSPQVPDAAVTEEQPPPVVNDRPFVQPAVREDLRRQFCHIRGAADVARDVAEREKIGLERYETLLQPLNGRDVRRDLYEEVIDALIYAKQALLEARETGDDLAALAQAYLSLVRVACLLRRTRSHERKLT